MRASVYHEYGGTEKLSVQELPTPRVGPGTVLVRVRSASVNPVDWKVMAGGLDALLDPVFPITPGWDVAGVVEAVGIDTPELAAGDEVVAYARKDALVGGTFAELVAVPVRAVARKPTSLSWDQAGALPLAGLTAYQSLTRLAVGAGDVVLVHGAAGGVGQMAVQVAVALGARVIGTASERNHELLRGFGAEPVAYGDGLVGRVRALAPEGVDVSLDLVGGVVAETRAVLREDGRAASIADPAVTTIGGAWLWARPDAEGLAALGRLADEGRLTVNVASVHPLDDVAGAFEQSMSGHVAGKVVVRVSQ